MTIEVYDRVAQEVVTKDEYARRQAERGSSMRYELPKFVERGRWVIKNGKLIPVSEYKPTPRNPAPMIMRDIEPYKSVVDGSYIGGRKQHRDHLRAHGVTEVGNEYVESQKKDLPPVADDVKYALEYSRSHAGNLPPVDHHDPSIDE